MNRMFLPLSPRGLSLCAALVLIASQAQAITFTVSPGSTSNTYNGAITLQVGGLSVNETVIISKYLDSNTNGVVEPSDYFVQQFQLQDGQGPTLIGGATNINIPYDHGVADGAISTTVSMATVGVIHRFAAQYLYVVSSPSNHFASITNIFLVTNPPTGQTITGTVLSNSTPVPYSAVLVGSAATGDFNPQTGTIANSNGVYSINVSPGLYIAVPLHDNNVGIPVGPIDVVASATVVTNLGLVGATATISGQVADAANASVPLPGLLLSAEGNGLATAVTDPNGNFTLPVTTGSQWKVGGDEGAWSFLGYVNSNDHVKFDVSGNVSGLQLSYPKGNAMFYGRVVDNNNQPLAGVPLFGQNANGSGAYQGSATTAANGKYSMALVDGNWDIGVDTGSLGPEFGQYIFSQALFAYNNGGGGTNFSPNSAVQQDFVAMLATNKISGFLRDSSSNGISGVQVFANAIINGTPFATQTTTDSSGFYSMSIGNGEWNVGVNCCNGCDNGLPSNYQCPNGQDVTISNNDQTVNFAAASYNTFISGQVRDEFGSPVTNMNVFANPTNGFSSFGATTDNGGNYSMGITAGHYLMQLNTDGSTGTPSLGLVSPFIPVTIQDGVSINNFNLIVRHVTGTIVATITNGDNGQPVSGISISANGSFNGTNYSSGTQPTGAGGSTTLQVFNGTWSVGLDCNALGSRNLTCAPNQGGNVADNAVSVNFIVHNVSVPAPQLSLPGWLNPGQFQFQLLAIPGHNYTLQYATALTNWSTFLITNPNSAAIMIFDNAATNSTRAYRALVGP